MCSATHIHLWQLVHTHTQNQHAITVSIDPFITPRKCHQHLKGHDEQVLNRKNKVTLATAGHQHYASGAGEPSSCPISSVRLTSPSFAQRRRLLNEMYNMMGALHGCRAVKFNSCNNL